MCLKHANLRMSSDILWVLTFGQRGAAKQLAPAPPRLPLAAAPAAGHAAASLPPELPHDGAAAPTWPHQRAAGSVKRKRNAALQCPAGAESFSRKNMRCEFY